MRLSDCLPTPVITDLPPAHFAEVLMEVSQWLALRGQHPEAMLWFAESLSIKPCGTVACHGGWLYVMAIEDELPGVCLESWERRVHLDNAFRHGARHIAQALKLRWLNRPTVYTGAVAAAVFLLPAWAAQNPSLWGNSYGFEMFNCTGYRAFGRIEKSCTLQTISEHYAAVAARVRSLGDAWPT